MLELSKLRGTIQRYCWSRLSRSGTNPNSQERTLDRTSVIGPIIQQRSDYVCVLIVPLADALAIDYTIKSVIKGITSCLKYCGVTIYGG